MDGAVAMGADAGARFAVVLADVAGANAVVGNGHAQERMGPRVGTKKQEMCG